jgi:hypothetical protein
MYPGKGCGMSAWPGIAKKVLNQLKLSKDRLLRKLMNAFIPECEETPDSAMPSGNGIDITQ